jgi:cell division protein FtsL
MKRSTFTALFICVNLAFVVAHIHKQSKFIRLSYSKQKGEMEKEKLAKELQTLTLQSQTLHDRAQVRQFASNTLQLKPVKISQIKKIEHDTNL